MSGKFLVFTWLVVFILGALFLGLPLPADPLPKAAPLPQAPAYPVRFALTVRGTDGSLLLAWDRTLPYRPSAGDRIDTWRVDEVSYSTPLERIVVTFKTFESRQKARDAFRPFRTPGSDWKELNFFKRDK